jgi:hypothetical protein
MGRITCAPQLAPRSTPSVLRPGRPQPCERTRAAGCRGRRCGLRFRGRVRATSGDIDEPLATCPRAAVRRRRRRSPLARREDAAALRGGPGGDPRPGCDGRLPEQAGEAAAALADGLYRSGDLGHNGRPRLRPPRRSRQGRDRQRGRDRARRQGRGGSTATPPSARRRSSRSPTIAGGRRCAPLACLGARSAPTRCARIAVR